MVKVIAIIVLAVLSFCGTLLGLMAVSGHLSKEQLKKVVAPQKTAEEKTSEEKEAEAPKDEAEPLARALQARDEELKRREEKVHEDEARLKKMQADLDTLRTDVLRIETKIESDMKTSVAATDEADKARLQDVAKSMGKMKPTNAIEIMKEWTPQEAAALMRLLKEKERVKILDAMPPEKAASILQALQPKPNATPPAP